MEVNLKLSGFFREPLVHFLLIGLALFLLYGGVATESSDSRDITVSQEDIQGMAQQFEAHWNRSPTEQELTGLVDSYVRDEVLYREGVAMGLESDDPVIKRRIRQKLEVVTEETSQQVAPTDAELAAYLGRNPDKFRQPARVSFEQVFFSGDAPVADLEQRTAEALVALRAGAAAKAFGQSTMLPPNLTLTSVTVIARDFGAEFASKLETLPLDAWQGPIASGFGAHLVRISERTPASIPALAEVRPQVLREWENERRERNRVAAYRAMSDNYRITIEGRPAADGQTP